MIFKINKLFLKIASLFKLILINILCVSVLFLYNVPAFSNLTDIEKDFAYKYCDSIERNLFKGLDNEKILKFKYFFNFINKGVKNIDIESFDNFAVEVENMCSYNLKSEEKEEFIKMLKEYLSTK